MATRQDVQRTARKWTNTPFAHQGRMLGKALDCVGLVLVVAEELGIKDKNGLPIRGTDHLNYGPEPVGTEVLDHCKARLIQKAIGDIKVGDIICTRIPENPTHTAIVTTADGAPHMIHAYQSGREVVVEHIIDFKWERRIVAAFEFPGIED